MADTPCPKLGSEKANSGLAESHYFAGGARCLAARTYARGGAGERGVRGAKTVPEAAGSGHAVSETGPEGRQNRTREGVF